MKVITFIFNTLSRKQEKNTNTVVHKVHPQKALGDFFYPIILYVEVLKCKKTTEKAKRMKKRLIELVQREMLCL